MASPVGRNSRGFGAICRTPAATKAGTDANLAASWSTRMSTTRQRVVSFATTRWRVVLKPVNGFFQRLRNSDVLPLGEIDVRQPLQPHQRRQIAHPRAAEIKPLQLSQPGLPAPGNHLRAGDRRPPRRSCSPRQRIDGPALLRSKALRLSPRSATAALRAERTDPESGLGSPPPATKANGS